jgi:hypothetical protein
MRSPRRPRLTGPERTQLAEKLRDDYEAGSTIRSLAQRNGYSYGTVHTLLLEAHTKLRKRGGRPRPAPGADA